MLADDIPPLRKGQDEMQKQSRLKQPRNDIGPVNLPIKRVQLSCVFERIRDKGDYAEDVEVSGTRSGPAAKKYINSNAEVNQCDQTKPIVKGTVCRRQNDAGIQGHRLS